MTAEAQDVLERQIRIEARPETIFAYLTDPEKMARWMGSKAVLDPRPGGIYQVNIGNHNIAQGEYIEVDPPRRVVFTFGWEGEGSLLPPGSSRVEITLEAEEEGTLVRLRHLDLPAEQRKLHAKGWEHYLARLKEVAEGYDPGPDPWASSTLMGS